MEIFLWSLPALTLLVLLTIAWVVKIRRERKFDERFRKIEAPLRRPLRLVMAPNYRWFLGWARVDMDEDPKSFTYLTEKSTRGRHFISGDELYILNWPEIPHSYKRDMLMAIILCGFTEYINERGERGDVRDLLR